MLQGQLRPSLPRSFLSIGKQLCCFEGAGGGGRRNVAWPVLVGCGAGPARSEGFNHSFGESAEPPAPLANWAARAPEGQPTGTRPPVNLGTPFDTLGPRPAPRGRSVGTGLWSFDSGFGSWRCCRKAREPNQSRPMRLRPPTPAWTSFLPMPCSCRVQFKCQHPCHKSR